MTPDSSFAAELDAERTLQDIVAIDGRTVIELDAEWLTEDEDEGT